MQTMARVFTLLILFLTSLVYGTSATAQTARPSTAAPLSLGNSLLPIYGPWKFHIGDSPIDPTTGKPLWAQPDFDDTTWETVDLTPKADADPFSQNSKYVPGWSQRGHSGYQGYAWYRIRVNVQAQPGQQLALAGPPIVDDAYQLFLNGTLLGNFGDFEGNEPKFYYSQPMIFPLPEEPAEGSVAGGQTLVFRFWMSATTLLEHSDAGGLHSAPLLGTADAIAAESQLRWLDLVRQNAVSALTWLVYWLLAAIAFSLFLFNRTDRVYLWMGVLFFALGLGGGETALATWTHTTTAQVELWITYVLVIPLVDFAWVMLLRAWFSLDHPRWLPQAAALLALGQAMILAAALDLLFPWVPHSATPLLYALTQLFRTAFDLLLAWMVFRGIRKHGLEGWLLAAPVALLWVDFLASRLAFLQIPRIFFPFGVSVTITQVIGFLMAFSMCALLVRRWVRSAQAQQKLAVEMKQAQEVQQVLIPETAPHIPGFSIHSIYQPAGQVGGDFFQILPVQRGAVLVCIGDVSGKGMPAAMTVSLLVGTLRTLAHYTQSPGEILAAMNRRMMGRSRGGFTTCLVLLVTGNGTVTIANAGHLAPYLNGRELPLENGLPLGLAAESTYSESTFHQEENQQITLVTDGVVEARAESGELFGFDRTAAIAAESAGSIAKTAFEFGQDDDITVLTLTRLPLGQQSSSHQTVAAVAPLIV
jgi:Stage II sporulation protein E (SpoIIE)